MRQELGLEKTDVKEGIREKVNEKSLMGTVYINHSLDLTTKRACGINPQALCSCFNLLRLHYH